ncbi:MAG TPA: sulfatase-like hydrolase/transferase [Thermoanaerobaculia bacterium]|nr:sulfatase-like hydrolase/transferase [Thermoanaerobaculia bacterium]
MKRLLCLLALLCACRARETAAPTDAVPAGDIVLVTIDTWRADAAGFAGNARVKTPFLDGLASRGIVFTNAHAHNVITLPSHANILTGLNPYQHGVRENAGYVLDANVETVAEKLHAAGYATGAFVAAFPLDARFHLDQGFDVYDDNYGKGRTTIDFALQERSANAVLESAANWWRTNDGRKRFLWVHLYEPHAPYTPPEPFASEYRDRLYLGEVAAADDALARSLAPLLNEQTTVIVTADHGEALGDHGELTHGLFAYEATLKVPLIVVAPGVQPHRENAYARHIDIAPTILERAGLTAQLPGQSLLHPLKKSDTYFEALSASLNRGWAPLTGLIHDDLKFIDLPVSELYDLPRDPAEARNLYAERRRESTAARAALRAVQVAPNAGRSISPEEASRLRSLGYMTGSTSANFTTADDPKNLIGVDRKIHEVIDLHQRGEAAKAVALARDVVREQPRMSSGRELLAFVLQESERVPEAIAVLRELLVSGQASTSTKLQLAKLLTETGHADEALALVAPLAGNNADADTLDTYGIALSDAGRPREAVAQFQRAISIDPEYAPAYQNLGITALRGNDLQTAEQNLDRALQLNPRLPLALNTLGVVYIRKGEPARAQDAWKRSFSLDRRQYDALYNLGLLAAQRGQREEARAALEEFIRIAPPPRYRTDIAAAKQMLEKLR